MVGREVTTAYVCKTKACRGIHSPDSLPGLSRCYGLNSVSPDRRGSPNSRASERALTYTKGTTDVTSFDGSCCRRQASNPLRPVPNKRGRSGRTHVNRPAGWGDGSTRQGTPRTAGKTSSQPTGRASCADT